MASEINGYINPFSSDFKEHANHYHDMSLGSKILTVFFSGLAFFVSLPLLGIAGYATFRSLVDRLAPIDHTHSKTTEKVDKIADQTKIKPKKADEPKRPTKQIQICSSLNQLESDLQRAQGEFSELTTKETLLEDQLHPNVDDKVKFEKLLQLAALYKNSHKKISVQTLSVKKKIDRLPKSQQTELLERIEKIEESYQKLDIEIFNLFVMNQPEIAKLFLEFNAGFHEEADQKIEELDDEFLKELGVVCYFIQDFFGRIQEQEDCHCEVNSLLTTPESQGVLPWFFSLLIVTLANSHQEEAVNKVHELVMEPATILQKKVNDELSHRYIAGQRPGLTFNRVKTPQPGGLNNLGNTCFINSSLQVILNTNLTKLIDRDIPEPVFSEQLDEKVLEQYLQDPDLIEDNERLKHAVKDYLVAKEEYPRIRAHQVALQKLKAVYTGADTSITIHQALKELRNVVINKETRLVELPPEYSQQDAGEFLSAALRGIAFHFNVRQKVACEDQMDRSERKDIMNYLTLHLVKEEVKKKARHSKRPATRYQSDFQKMLEAYKVEQIDDPHNMWTYEGEDVPRQHHKYSKTHEIVDEIPDTLVVQIKRFHFNDRGNISRKDSTPLIMKEEVDFRTLIDESLLTEDTSTRYRVVGIVNHGGGIGGGHYTADVKIDGKWENRSDSSVDKDLSESIIKEDLQNGYIFVFERIK